MSDDLLFEVKDKIAVMTLNRPEAMSAFTPDILTSWVARLEECQHRDDVSQHGRAGIGVGRAARALCGGGNARICEVTDRSKSTDDRTSSAEEPA